MHLYIYVYIHIYRDAYKCTCAYVHVCIHTHIPTYQSTTSLPTYMRTYVGNHAYIPTYLHTCILTYSDDDILVRLHTYIVTYRHAYLLKGTLTYTRLLSISHLSVFTTLPAKTQKILNPETQQPHACVGMEEEYGWPPSLSLLPRFSADRQVHKGSSKVSPKFQSTP